MSDVTESKRRLPLPSDCSIASIRQVHESIRDAFGRSDGLEIDCSAVDKADVTSIQLLLSAAETGKAQGRPVVLTAFSQSLRNILRRAGFSGDEMIDRYSQKKDGM